jgi:hypothetical protein
MFGSIDVFYVSHRKSEERGDAPPGNFLRGGGPSSGRQTLLRIATKGAENDKWETAEILRFR